MVCAPARMFGHVQDFVVSWDFFAVYNLGLLGKCPFDQTTSLRHADAAILEAIVCVLAAAGILWRMSAQTPRAVHLQISRLQC